MDDGASAHSATSAASATSRGYMSAEEQDERRKQIRDIMKDPKLSDAEKNRTIQSLMDGRRRGSGATRSVASTDTSGFPNNDVETNYVNSMAAAAAAAAEYYSSDDEGDTVMSDAPAHDDISYGYNKFDDRSLGSSSNEQAQAPQGPSYRETHGRSLSLQDFPDRVRQTAAVSTSIFSENPAQISRLMEQSRPPCNHYERNCTLISPCCGLAFGCRICHDECPVLPPPLELRKAGQTDTMLLDSLSSKKQKQERRHSMPTDLEEYDDETHHAIDRFAVREIICRQCFVRQPGKTNYCIGCGVQFGSYHCHICNLWMSDKESPYHCEDCGFCRVGGRENFTHCDHCGMCIDSLLFGDHNCKAGKYMSNCPICQEDLFSSRYASHEMPCGHAIHWHCFKELTSYDARCPVCKKTAEPPDQMATAWSAIAMGIALQPVPVDMARVVTIFCNDCEQTATNRRWHFLGVRCLNCMSFNTNLEQVIMTGRDAAEFLDNLEASQAGAGGVPANISMPAPIPMSQTQGGMMPHGPGGMMPLGPGGMMPLAPGGMMPQAPGGMMPQAPGGMSGTMPPSLDSDAMDEDAPVGQDASSGSTDSYYR